MSNEEFSYEVDEKSIDNLKKIIDSELEERSKRFNNGVETIDDLINGYRHYKICNDKGLDLDVVELKHYKRLIDFYKQAKSDLYEANNRINDLLDIVKQKDKIIDELVTWIEEHENPFEDCYEYKISCADIECKDCIRKYFEERCK